MEPQPKRLSAAKRAWLRVRPVRIWALEQARLYVGVKEHPAGSNRGPHIDRWERWANGIVGYPWCAAFVNGMYVESAKLVLPPPKRASVGFLEEWAQSVGAVLKVGVRPAKGDLVCYRFDADNWPDHIGIVDSVVSWKRGVGGTLKTIEGNTAAGNDANGGQVQVRYRTVSASRVRFIRVDRKKLRKANV